MGHGDSTVIEYVDPTGVKHFGLIDSNRRKNETPPALRTLRRLGATRLAFVALTHPHADHFSGMLAILEAFKGRIDHIFTYPFERENPRLKKWAEAYGKDLEGVENEEVLAEAEELLQIIHAFRGYGDAWEPKSNPGAILHVDVMHDVDISILTPPASVKGALFSAIDAGKSPLRQDRGNELSLSLSFKYAGRTFVVGGDGTYNNWIYARKRTKGPAPGEPGNLAADAFRLPHHGSRQDSAPLVIDFVIKPQRDVRVARRAEDGIQQGDLVALVSADGKSHHPAKDVLHHLQESEVLPFCTNLSIHCSPAQPQPSVSSNVVDEALVRFVGSVAESTSRPPACQGDIVYSIDSNGDVAIDRQFKTSCIYRNELDFLAA